MALRLSGPVGGPARSRRIASSSHRIPGAFRSFADESQSLIARASRVGDSAAGWALENRIHLIADGAVLIDGRPSMKSDRLLAGALVTMAGVVALGVMEGILIGVVFSLVLLLRALAKRGLVRLAYGKCEIPDLARLLAFASLEDVAVT